MQNSSSEKKTGTNRVIGSTRKQLRILALPYLDIQKKNPYQRLLYQEFSPEQAIVERFTPLRLAAGRWAIWHVHWPESLLNGFPPRALHRALARVAKFWVYLKIAQ